KSSSTVCKMLESSTYTMTSLTGGCLTRFLTGNRSRQTTIRPSSTRSLDRLEQDIRRSAGRLGRQLPDHLDPPQRVKQEVVQHSNTATSSTVSDLGRLLPVADLPQRRARPRYREFASRGQFSREQSLRVEKISLTTLQ